jgi:mRNA interferase MazF
LKRGDIWTVAGGSDYAGKPRPCVIIQDDRFAETKSVVVCGFSTEETDAPIFRLLVEPSDRNGLRSRSFLMVDKINSVPRAKLGRHVGTLDAEDMARLTRAALTFLGMVGSSRDA